MIVFRPETGRIRGMKRYQVKVITRAKRPRIKATAPGSFKVFVSAPAVDGKANQAVIASLADWFGVKKRAVQIIRGLKSRDKIIEIDRP